MQSLIYFLESKVRLTQKVVDSQPHWAWPLYQSISPPEAHRYNTLDVPGQFPS